MSDKKKLSKKAREERQEKQAKAVIKWIFITLGILAIATMVWSVIMIG
ncbi:hypothetical protein [Prevotella ihumii]|nr:hypothetical protein [Prevotella ihumii]